MVLETLNPDYRFSYLFNITPEWMDKYDYRILLVDLDNTLLPRNSTIVPERHIKWLQKMQREGISIVLTSNNGGGRVRVIEQKMKEKGLLIPILTWAGKPFPRAYTDAIRLMYESQTADSDDIEKCTPSGILAAGDQLFTDVLGAHWYNLPVALVRPLSPNDFIGTKVLRVLERCVIWCLKKRGVFPEEDKEY